MIYIWIAAIVVLSLIEINTVNLTTIWFVGGAIAAAAVSFVTDDFLLQFGVFVSVGTLLLATTRKTLLRFVDKRKVATNADRVIGMEGVVTEAIAPMETGEVRVDGKRWTAFSDEELAEGTVVAVLAIDGVKLQVERRP